MNDASWRVACGMYAFTPELKNAWRELFSHLPECRDGKPVSVDFDCDEQTYRKPNLLLGHTCGYPYLKYWAKSHAPLCIPSFQVDGVSGTQYSSWFITGAQSAITDLTSARGCRVAVNDWDSNSGMNVLRYAVAVDLQRHSRAGGNLLESDNKKFFSEVIISNSHINSIQLIADGHADLAAIDAVTFALQLAAQPKLKTKIKIIGQSAATTALPFITPDTRPIPQGLIPALNQCCDRLSPKSRDTLKLTGFLPVTKSDYANITQLETAAIAAGYPAII